jgi:hypothetical protein
MRSFRAIAALVLAFAVATPALAQRSFDPRAYQSQVYGERTQILVLGTPHLSGTPDGWDPAVLEPLLERLAAFRPDVIAIEGLSGESVNALWEYRELYGETPGTYGWRIMSMAAMARQNIGLDMPDAEAEARRILLEWPASPTPAQRRHLAAVLCAAGDPHSALVQWWKLDASERRAEDGLSALLVEQLNAYDTRRNENHLIGVRLAVRLGHERIYPVDDHADDDALTPQANTDLEAFWGEPWVAELMSDQRAQPLREAASLLATPDQVLDTYRMLNRPATAKFDADWQWLPFVNRPSPNLVGRTRVGLWEARNLRQVAHIRELTAMHPGQRILVIVGSGHKAWFDYYLGTMHDVEMVDVGRVLR